MNRRSIFKLLAGILPAALTNKSAVARNIGPVFDSLPASERARIMQTVGGNSQLAEELAKLVDGKYPPDIWIVHDRDNNRVTGHEEANKRVFDGIWYQGLSEDQSEPPNAPLGLVWVRYIEVANSAHASIAFTSPSRYGNAPYHQKYLSVDQMGKMWKECVVAEDERLKQPNNSWGVKLYAPDGLRWI